MDELVRLAAVSEIRPGCSKRFAVQGLYVAVFNAAGAFYALQDRCPGDGESLSAGTITGSIVECRSDKALFYLPTGECLDRHHLGQLTSWRIRIARQDLQISLPEAPSLPFYEHRAIAAGQRRIS